MSAVLSPSTSFSARLTLAAGVLVTIEAPSLSDLSSIVGKLQAANETPAAPSPAPAAGKSKPAGTTAATAPAGQPASQTAASSAPAAAAQGAGEAGNAASAGQDAAASPASSTKPEGAAEVTFESLKKAFLALSTKPDGRAKCEAVLASVDPKPGRLTEAKPEQYQALMEAIEKAAK